MDATTKERLADRSIWVRGLYMLFFVITYAVAETLVSLLAIFQFISALITGRVNDALLRFGANLSTYVYEILQFATFNAEKLPFPFSDWPDVEPGSNSPWISTAPTSGTPGPADETPAESVNEPVSNAPDEPQQAPSADSGDEEPPADRER